MSTNASTSVVSGSCPSVRRHLTAGVTIASAGILAVSLVMAPPDVHGASIEVRQVQLAAFPLPSAPSSGLLEKFISNQAHTVAPVALVVPGGRGGYHYRGCDKSAQIQPGDRPCTGG